MSSISPLYRRLTYILVVTTFMLILMGGYVKAIGAGLSCPDWPLCYGKVFPFFGNVESNFTPWEIFAEWFHRLWAASVGLLLLVVVYMSSRFRKEIPLPFNLGLILIVLFGAQVILGGLTVLRQLDELIVVAHLGNSVLIVMIEMTIAFYVTAKTMQQ